MVPYSTGVDATNTTVLTYDDGLLATATSSRAVASDRSGVICGDNGYAVVTNINNPATHRRVQHGSFPSP